MICKVLNFALAFLLSMFQPLLVTTSLASLEDCEKIATVLLNKRLVACAQISGPCKSLYWWKNTIEQEDEYILTLKTEISLYGQLEKEIKILHPYDVPEIVAIEITRISKEYKTWLEEELDFEG